MKKILIYIFIFSVILFSGFQIKPNLLDGKIFFGKAVEIASPENDRTPVLMDEVIVFDKGNVSCGLFKNFSVDKSNYTAEVDGRRAIAIEVIVFSSSFTTVYNGSEVLIEFTGEVFAGEKLSGNLKIKYFNNKTEEYTIVGASR